MELQDTTKNLLNNKTTNFVKLNRNADAFWKLVQKRHSAFILLSIIAQRARRYSDEETGLEVGEAWLGDFESYNTTRSKYRTDLKYLINFGLITTRKHDIGTAAKLIDSTIFDINPAEEITTVTINKNSERTNKMGNLLTMYTVDTPGINSNPLLLAVHKDN